MKTTILSLLSWCLLAIPATAQDNTDTQGTPDLKAMQRLLDAGDNVLGVRIESCEDIVIDKLDSQVSESQSNAKPGQLRMPSLQSDKAKKTVISYMSKDGKKNAIRLSAVIYTNDEYSIQNLVLNCHPTVTSLFEAPTGGNPVDKDIQRVTDDDVMVVCPDYCGYGMSGYMQHPYLIHDVTARNCIDALLAAIYYKETVFMKTNTVPTSIVGYSQGGATALACAKYIESAACSQADRDKINLKQTTCGDGPYSTIATVEQYLEWGQKGKNLEYPCVLPLIIAAAIDAYGDGCMRTVKLEDYLSEKFIKTGIINKLKNKSITTVDLNEAIKNAMDNHLLPTDLFSDKLIDKQGNFIKTSNEYKCLMRAMEMNDLSKGWVPQHKIFFFHLENDGVVPYRNLKAIETGIKTAVPEGRIKIVKPKDVFSNIKVIRALSSITGGIPSPDECNHASGGMLFYSGYMFGNTLWE